MSITPKSISEISPAERYKLAVANEVLAASAKTDAHAAHTVAMRGVQGLAEGEDHELLKQTVDTFFQPTMPTHERVKTAKEVLRTKAAELGYDSVNQLRKALGEAIASSGAALEVGRYLKTLEPREVIELVLAAMMVRSSALDGSKVAEHVATHLGLTKGHDDIEAAAAKLHLDTWATLTSQDRIDLALDVLGKHVVPAGAATVGELGNNIAPIPKEELREIGRRAFGKRERVPGGPRGPREIFARAAEPLEASDLEARARFKKLPLNEQYQAILGTVVLRSFGASPSKLNEKAEKIFELVHPHRGESPDVLRMRRIDANRTFLAPGQGDADKEKQMLAVMQKRAQACGCANAQELMALVASMADRPATLDAELFNTEPNARIQVVAASLALTQDGALTNAQREVAKVHAKQMQQRMFMAMGEMMTISLVNPDDSATSPPPTATQVAERLGERLVALGLPRDEAVEKAAVDALYASEDYAETARLARASIRGWTKDAGLRFSVDVIESMAAAAAPSIGPPEEDEEPSSPFEMLRGGKDATEVGKKSFTSETPSRPVDEIITEMRSYAGWDDAKKFVDDAMLAIEYDKFCREAGLPSQFQLQHLVLKGPPGTGKTTFAKLYAELLHASGLLPANTVTRAKATDMVSRFLGGTAHDTQKILDAALGGVLFIDEIYRLARVREYGQEAIDAINEFLDEHRDEFVCVVTGYTDETNDFLERNPGLKDRFGEELFFPAFSMETMLESVQRLAGTTTTIDSGAWPAIRAAFEGIDMEAPDFASGRTARKMFEEWQKHMKVRIVPEARAAKARDGEVSPELLTTLKAEDVTNRAQVVTKKNPVGFVWTQK